MGEVEEVWLPIEGFEESYQVSNHGRVRSIDRVIAIGGKKTLICHYKSRLLTPTLRSTPGRGRYLAVVLYKNKRPVNCWLHILVAKAFVPNPQNLPQVNHKDGDKANPYFGNLEWSTSLGNIAHARELGLLNYSRRTPS